MIPPAAGSFIYVFVALDKLQNQYKARVAEVTFTGETALLARVIVAGTKISVALADEGVAWCRWGQARVMDALRVAHALGSPIQQVLVGDLIVVTTATL